jgi:hypothetical protein
VTVRGEDGKGSGGLKAMTTREVKQGLDRAVSVLHLIVAIAAILVMIGVPIGGALIEMYSRQQRLEQQVSSAQLPELGQRMARIEVDVRWLRVNEERKEDRRKR